MRVVLKSQFYHDGRGPELRRTHYSRTGSIILAVDYVLPDASSDEVWNIRFLKSQVFMFTPEEVENYIATSPPWAGTDRGAAICFGRSKWLESFSTRHLQRCEHFKLMFYDEYLDVICEGVEAARGAYSEPTK
jgi:hypothetical protein